MVKLRSLWANPGNRNMLLFFTAKLASILGSGMFTFVVCLYILKVTGSGSSFAVTMVCGMLPRIILAPFAGVMADRMNRRRLLICSDLAAVVSLLLAYLAVSLNGVTLTPVYVTLVLLSVCSTFYSIAVSSSLLQLVEPDSLQRAGSLNQIAGSIGNLLAPVLGGMLYAVIPLKLFLLLNAAGFAVSTLMSIGLKFNSAADPADPAEQQQPQHPARTRPQVWAEFRSSLAEGMSYAFKKPVIRSVLVIVFWVNFFVVALNVVLPYAVVQTLSLGSGQYGTINAMLAAGMLAMSLLLTVRRQGSSPTGSLIRGLFMLGLLFLALAVPLILDLSRTGAYVYLMVMLFMVGCTVMNINIPVQVYLQQSVEPAYLGRVFAVAETASGAIAPLGMVLYGVLVDRVPSFLLLAASGMSILLVTLLGSRNLKQGTRREEQQMLEAGVQLRP
ncbi:MFS transporter [Paenibacillus sp. FSL R7-0345]|uniref:MFS transporter n=1 Tax=Paenibacillus sp. FSL R7-0345 TaxID=2954535 RepID=UPI003159E3AC